MRGLWTYSICRVELISDHLIDMSMEFGSNLTFQHVLKFPTSIFGLQENTNLINKNSGHGIPSWFCTSATKGETHFASKLKGHYLPSYNFRIDVGINMCLGIWMLIQHEVPSNSMTGTLDIWVLIIFPRLGIEIILLEHWQA